MDVYERPGAQNFAAGDLERKAEIVGGFGAEEQLRVEDQVGLAEEEGE